MTDKSDSTAQNAPEKIPPGSRLLLWAIISVLQAVRRIGLPALSLARRANTIFSSPRRMFSDSITASQMARCMAHECWLRVILAHAESEPPVLQLVQSQILLRITQTQYALARLIDGSYHGEAGILALSQLEMILDMEYIGTDSKRAQEWIDHREFRRQPWKVKDKIVALGTRDAHTFSLLSAIKHGNPVAHWFAMAWTHPEMNPAASTYVNALASSYVFRAICAVGDSSSSDVVGAFVGHAGAREQRRQALLLASAAMKARAKERAKS